MRSLQGKYILTFTEKIPLFWGKTRSFSGYKFVLLFNDIFFKFKVNYFKNQLSTKI